MDSREILRLATHEAAHAVALAAYGAGKVTDASFVFDENSGRAGFRYQLPPGVFTKAWADQIHHRVALGGAIWDTVIEGGGDPSELIDGLSSDCIAADMYAAELDLSDLALELAQADVLRVLRKGERAIRELGAKWAAMWEREASAAEMPVREVMN